jgi:purine-nucleoside phosphorylase
MVHDLTEKYQSIFDFIKEFQPFEVENALILGSGMGDFAEKLEIVKSISSSDLPNYPKSTVEGHKGFIHFCKYQGKKIVVFQGRIHLYEGYSISESLLHIIISHEIGVKNLVLTNAAGGIDENLKPGDIMLISAFNTFNVKKYLSSFLGQVTLDEINRIRTNFPSKELSQKMTDSAIEENIYLPKGSYFFNTGPTYETKSEIQMIKKLGFSAVGMSTAHEAIFASKLGLDVVAFSLITNYAAGISPHKLSHTEVMETAELSKSNLERLMKRFIISI